MRIRIRKSKAPLSSCIRSAVDRYDLHVEDVLKINSRAYRVTQSEIYHGETNERERERENATFVDFDFGCVHLRACVHRLDYAFFVL